MAKILDRAKSAGEMAIQKGYRLKVLQVSPSGNGKTQNTITLPQEEGKEILLIDYDNRAQSLYGELGIKILTLFDPDPNSPKAWVAAEVLRRELWGLVKGGVFPYSAIVEDGLSMMLQIAMNHALTFDMEHVGLGGAPGQSHWMPQIHFIRSHINSMRMLPCHYVLNAHLESLNDGVDGVLKYFPKVTKSLRPELPAWFNETYLCRKKVAEGKDGKKKLSYYWITSGTGKFDFFKSTLNTQGKFWNDPMKINLDEKPAGFSKLLALRFGELEREEEKDGETDGEGIETSDEGTAEEAEQDATVPGKETGGGTEAS